MIELIDDLPDAVVGLEAVGEVTADDYTSVAFLAVERALTTNRKIRLLHVLDERFDGYAAGALRDDVKLGLGHLFSWERIAVVSDLESIHRLVKAVGWSAPGEMRLFPNAERSKAVRWVSAGLEPTGGQRTETE